MLDTHIAVALYEGRTAGLSSPTLRRIDREPVSISPIVLLELEFLYEIHRLRVGGAEISRHLSERLSIRVAGERYTDIAMESLALGFTRDPFDRLIVAHALLLDAALVTQDNHVSRYYAKALA